MLKTTPGKNKRVIKPQQSKFFVDQRNIKKHFYRLITTLSIHKSCDSHENTTYMD